MKSLRVLSIAALSIALLATAAVEVVPASAGPTASVAKKKKCSKKTRKKHKCGKQGGDATAALTALFAGSSVSSVSNGLQGTNTDVYKFCRSGSYTEQIDNDGTNGGTPFHRVTSYAGSWKMSDGLRRKTGELRGALTTTVDSFQDSEGAAPPPPEVLPFVNVVVVPPGEPFIVIGDHPVWTRTAGGAGC